MVSHSNGSELSENVWTAGQLHPSRGMKDPSIIWCQQIVPQSTIVKCVDFVIRRNGTPLPRFRASKIAGTARQLIPWRSLNDLSHICTNLVKSIHCVTIRHFETEIVWRSRNCWKHLTTAPSRTLERSFQFFSQTICASLSPSTASLKVLHSVHNGPTQSTMAPLDPQWPHLIRNDPTWSAMAPLNLRWPHLVHDGPTQSAMAQLSPQWPDMVRDDPSWSTMAPLGPQWPHSVCNGPTWSVMAQLGPQWPHSVREGPTLSAMAWLSPRWPHPVRDGHTWYAMA